MRGVHPENHETVARAVDLAVAAGERWEIALTYFLEPPEAADVLLAVSRLADVEARPWGGYPNAERVRMRLGRPEVLDAEGDEPKGVTLLDVAGNFMVRSPSWLSRLAWSLTQAPSSKLRSCSLTERRTATS